MTEQEVEIGNKKIELHNKFCFMKQTLPKYREKIPLYIPIVYFMISAFLLVLPTFLPTLSYEKPHCFDEFSKTENKRVWSFNYNSNIFACPKPTKKEL